MEIISWFDIRRAALAIFVVILPTILLSIYITSALQMYHINGASLWQLKKKNVPDEVIEPLHELRLKEYFFKYRLMNAIESRISNSDLYKKYKISIVNQINIVPMPAVEYIFLLILSLFYGILWILSRKYFFVKKK